MLHIIHEFGGVENLKGKEISHVLGLLSFLRKAPLRSSGCHRPDDHVMGMDVVLAHPEGYDVMPEVEEVAKDNAEKSGGTFTKTNSMEEAFQRCRHCLSKELGSFRSYGRTHRTLRKW